MRALARRYAVGVTAGLPIPRHAIAEIVERLDARRNALDTGDRILNDDAVAALTAAVVGMGQATPE